MDYETVRGFQRKINKMWSRKPLKYKGGLDYLDKNAYDFKFDYVDIAENYVQYTFMSDIDGELDECVDFFTVQLFNKYFEVE
jgi:hypothetical protein